MRILFITETDDKEREEKNFKLHISRLKNITLIYTSANNQLITNDIKQYDAVICFIKFKNLVNQNAIDWKHYTGLRLLYDHDTVQNFGSYFENNLKNQWNKEIIRHKFDAIIATSSSSVEKFKASGINSYWLPKSYDADRFFDKQLHRSGYCTFGTAYRSRAKMMKKITSSKIPVVKFTSKYESLNDELNKYSACVICNMPASVPYGKIGRAIERLSPGLLARPMPGSEVFFKNLESAAAGCIQVCDSNQDLEKLGYKDWKNCITYTNFDELIDKLRSIDDIKINQMKTNSVKTTQLHTNKIRAHQIEKLCQQIANGTQYSEFQFQNTDWIDFH